MWYEFLPNGNLDQWLHQYTVYEHCDLKNEQKALNLISKVWELQSTWHPPLVIFTNISQCQLFTVALSQAMFSWTMTWSLMLLILGLQGFCIKIQTYQVGWASMR
jgi:hypothetical protein